MVYIKDDHVSRSVRRAALIAPVVMVKIKQIAGSNKTFWYHSAEDNKLIKKPRPFYNFAFRLFQLPKLNEATIYITVDE